MNKPPNYLLELIDYLKDLVNQKTLDDYVFCGILYSGSRFMFEIVNILSIELDQPVVNLIFIDEKKRQLYSPIPLDVLKEKTILIFEDTVCSGDSLNSTIEILESNQIYNYLTIVGYQDERALLFPIKTDYLCRRVEMQIHDYHWLRILKKCEAGLNKIREIKIKPIKTEIPKIDADRVFEDILAMKDQLLRDRIP